MYFMLHAYVTYQGQFVDSPREIHALNKYALGLELIRNA